MNSLLAGLAGLLFGAGLLISEMVDPARVLGFLDVAGEWDPTLMFVMGGALAVTVPGFWWAARLRKPLVATEFHWPRATDIDRRLILGAVLFGVGWGLAGLCPGPAVVAAASLRGDVWLFVAAMLIGLVLGPRHRG
ncbi:MAG: YeeE/YedE family protein [Abyssibacter sp.]|uniref:YeeE/YedE family protein n=1 Tax=Abyssibacter sp. TaxID=2320200 RepID=UPI00321ABC55